MNNITECACEICDKWSMPATIDDDLGGCVCRECLPHVIKANDVIIFDLRKCGILK